MHISASGYFGTLAVVEIDVRGVTNRHVKVYARQRHYTPPRYCVVIDGLFVRHVFFTEKDTLPGTLMIHAKNTFSWMTYQKDSYFVLINGHYVRDFEMPILQEVL